MRCLSSVVNTTAVVSNISYYVDAWCVPRQGSWLLSRSLWPLRWYSTAFIPERWLCRPENPSSTSGRKKSFSVAGPRAWNSLPSHMRTLVSRDSFSRHLKTHFQALLHDIQWFVPMHVVVFTVYVLMHIFNVSFSRCWSQWA